MRIKFELHTDIFSKLIEITYPNGEEGQVMRAFKVESIIKDIDSLIILLQEQAYLLKKDISSPNGYMESLKYKPTKKGK